jgi:hypothetical protein
MSTTGYSLTFNDLQLRTPSIPLAVVNALLVSLTVTSDLLGSTLGLTISAIFLGFLLDLMLGFAVSMIQKENIDTSNNTPIVHEGQEEMILTMIRGTTNKKSMWKEKRRCGRTRRKHTP